MRFPRTTVRKRISKAQKRDFAYTLLKVLLNLQPELYVLLKYLFSKTSELGSNLADFERGAKFLQRSLKRFFSEQYVRNSVTLPR